MLRNEYNHRCFSSLLLIESVSNLSQICQVFFYKLKKTYLFDKRLDISTQKSILCLMSFLFSPLKGLFGVIFRKWKIFVKLHFKVGLNYVDIRFVIV